MKFDSRYSASIRPVFRVFAFIIGVPMLLMGTGFLINGLISKPFVFNHDFKFGIAGTLWGLLFVAAAIKGSLPKWMDSDEREREYEKRINEGESTTRDACLRSLGGFLFLIFLLVLMFFTTEIFSIFWWFTIIMTVIIAYFVYLNFTLLLLRKGYNSLLALTLIFPIGLLLMGAICPNRFDKMNGGV